MRWHGEKAVRKRCGPALPPWGCTRLRRRPARRPTAGAVVAHRVAQGAVEPAGYWLARLPVKISMKCLVGIRKHRWVIERDYEELKSELGLAHYEGRNWRGFTTTPHSALRLTAF